MNAKKTATALTIRVLGLLLAMGMFASPVLAGTVTQSGVQVQGGANPLDTNVGGAIDTEKNFLLRNPNAGQFAPTDLGGSDVIQDKTSVGPGVVTVGPQNSGPAYSWPVSIPTITSPVKTMRDQAITQSMLKTTGYMLSDTQYQLISRYNYNRFLEQISDPQRWTWMMTAMGGMQSTSAANSTGAMASNQAQTAIGFTKSYLTNFTAEPNNQWQQIRDQLFIPMAVLLLLPGAVLAQVRAIVAQGSPILGDVNPFEGIIRSIICIVLIPGTFLVINYGIDVANSITYTIADEYKRIFGTDMYDDAVCGQIRAFAGNSPNAVRNAILPNGNINQGVFSQFAAQGGNPEIAFEAKDYATRILDVCAGIDQQVVADEDSPWNKQVTRFMLNGGNAMLAQSWNVMCAFQMVYLYYLWCMGPIAAALWVWPIGKMRSALPSWVEGVIVLCFWSLFWNTVILLMACFRGTGETGTIIFTALNSLALYSVQFAFDFTGLVTSGAAQGVQQALQGMMQGAQQAAQAGGSTAPGGHGGKGRGGHGGGQGGGAARGGHAGPGGAGAAGAQGAAGGQHGAGPGGLNSQLAGATAQNMHSPLLGGANVMAGGGPTGAGMPGLHGTPGQFGAHAALGGGLGTAGQSGMPGASGTLPGQGGPPLAAGIGHGGAQSTNSMTAGLNSHAGGGADGGLGMKLDHSGHLQMNQEALNKLQNQLGGQDPQKALANALQAEKNGNHQPLNDFMKAAQGAGVLDPTSANAIGSMANNGMTPNLGVDGNLQLSPKDANALGANSLIPTAGAGTMADTGLLNQAGGPPNLGPVDPLNPNANALTAGAAGLTGGLTGAAGLDPTGAAGQGLNAQGTGFPMTDAKGLPLNSTALDNALQGNAPNGMTQAQANGLGALAQQENAGQLGFRDAVTGQPVSDLNSAQHAVQAFGANGQSIAQFDPQTGQWTAAGTAGQVTMGADSQWHVGGANGVPVSADASGNFSASGTNFAYNSQTNSFDLGHGASVPASAVGGDVLRDYSNGVPGASATMQALSQPGVAQNLEAAVHNHDAQAMQSVQAGLQGTGVNAESLYSAAHGNQLAATSVMGQEASMQTAAGQQYAHQMAQQLGVSEAMIKDAGSNPLSAASVLNAETKGNDAFAREVTQHMPAGSDQLLAQAGSNPVAAAQFVGMEARADSNYGSQVAQSLRLADSSMVQSMGTNPVLAAQTVGAEAVSSASYAQAVSGMTGYNIDTVQAAATNPTVAASMVGMEARNSAEYGQMVAQSMPSTTPQMIAEAASSPLAATQVAAAAGVDNPNYGRDIVGPSMHISQPDHLAAVANSPVAAAAALGAEMRTASPELQSSIANSMHVSPAQLESAASSYVSAAQVVASDSVAHSGYGELASAAMHTTPQMMEYASSSSTAAAQILASEARGYDGGVQHVASALGVSPDVVSQAAAGNAVAAAQMVAGDAVANHSVNSLASAAHVTPDVVMSAVSNQGAAAQLMAGETSRSSSEYFSQVANSLHMAPTQMAEAAYRPEIANAVANASYQASAAAVTQSVEGGSWGSPAVVSGSAGSSVASAPAGDGLIVNSPNLINAGASSIDASSGGFLPGSTVSGGGQTVYESPSFSGAGATTYSNSAPELRGIEGGAAPNHMMSSNVDVTQAFGGNIVQSGSSSYATAYGDVNIQGGGAPASGHSSASFTDVNQSFPGGNVVQGSNYTAGDVQHTQTGGSYTTAYNDVNLQGSAAPMPGQGSASFVDASQSYSGGNVVQTGGNYTAGDVQHMQTGGSYTTAYGDVNTQTGGSYTTAYGDVNIQGSGTPVPGQGSASFVDASQSYSSGNVVQTGGTYSTAAGDVQYTNTGGNYTNAYDVQHTQTGGSHTIAGGDVQYTQTGGNYTTAGGDVQYNQTGGNYTTAYGGGDVQHIQQGGGNVDINQTYASTSGAAPSGPIPGGPTQIAYNDGSQTFVSGSNTYAGGGPVYTDTPQTFQTGGTAPAPGYVDGSQTYQTGIAPTPGYVDGSQTYQTGGIAPTPGYVDNPQTIASNNFVQSTPDAYTQGNYTQGYQTAYQDNAPNITPAPGSGPAYTAEPYQQTAQNVRYDDSGYSMTQPTTYSDAPQGTRYADAGPSVTAGGGQPDYAVIGDRNVREVTPPEGQTSQPIEGTPPTVIASNQGAPPAPSAYVPPSEHHPPGGLGIVPAVVSRGPNVAKPAAPPPSTPENIEVADAGPKHAEDPMHIIKQGGYKRYTKEQRRKDLRDSAKGASWLPDEEEGDTQIT